MPMPELPRDELQAAVRARHELDPELDGHLVDSFLDRVERSIDARVDARIDARLAARAKAERRPSNGPSVGSILLAFVSFGCGIGVTGAATGMDGSQGVLVALVAWIAIGAVNVAYAVHR